MENGSSQKPETIPQHFMQQVRKYGNKRVAVRQKEFGIWQEFTWQDAHEHVRDFALGLVSLGLERGQRVTIVGDNDRQYLWADIGVMAAGGVAVGIFTDSAPKEVEFIASHSEAIFSLAKDQEQVDKMLSVRDKVPHVRKVIYWDPRGLWSYDDDWLMSFDEVLELGRQLHRTQPDLFDQLVAEGKYDDYCNFCYTSGTTGVPKGAMLSHGNFIHAVESGQRIEPRYPSDNLVSFAPLAWIAEHTLAVTPHVVYGIMINFPEEPETVQQDIREIAPDIIFYPSRLWEGITATIQVRISDSSWFNRMLYGLFLPVGYKVGDLKYENKPVPPHLAALNWLGDKLVFRPLRSQFGMVNVRSAITAGSSLSPDMLRFFRALGLNLKQVFGTTETSAAGTRHRDDDVKFASIGTADPDIYVKVVDGELVVGGGNIFHGYYKNDEATREAIKVDDNGVRWFYTGDAAYMDEDEHVIYLDRMKDMIQLASGERFSPQFIEGRLKFSPYIRDAMAVGNEEVEFVTAIVSIDFGNVGRWAEKHNISYTTYVDLSQREEVLELIRKDVEEVNSTLPPGGRVRKFVSLHKEFDADESEITRTRKLRRRFLVDRYGDLIFGMYEGKQNIEVSAFVQYRDGREGTIQTNVHVVSLDSEGVPA